MISPSIMMLVELPKFILPLRNLLAELVGVDENCSCYPRKAGRRDDNYLGAVL